MISETGFPEPRRPATGGDSAAPDRSRPALRFDEGPAPEPFSASGLFDDRPADADPEASSEPQAEVTVATDAELQELVDRARRRGDAPPPVHLVGGSLLGVLRQHAPGTTEHVVDLGSVLIDGRRHWFTTQLVARRHPWRGRSVVVANAPWTGTGFTSPASDPGDGVLEVIDAELGTADQARMRAGRLDREAPTHPALRRSVVAAIEIELGRPTPIFLDGEQVAIARYLSVSIEPGALTCRT